MEEFAAIAILLTVIAYLIVRVLLFANATRRKEETSTTDKEKPSGS